MAVLIGPDAVDYVKLPLGTSLEVGATYGAGTVVLHDGVKLLEVPLWRSYLAGCILLGVAPCTAMVLVWSYLARGNVGHTLIMVAVNSLTMLVLYGVIGGFLLGVGKLPVPWQALLLSIGIYVALPLVAGYFSRKWILAANSVLKYPARHCHSSTRPAIFSPSVRHGGHGGFPMAMGRRKAARQEPLFVTAEQLPRSQGHPFYKALNALLSEAGFDRWIEGRCQPYYEQVETRGQRSTPPGVYFRMLLVGYFEGIDSQRGIAWRCSDSLSLREFLGIPLHEGSPEHSTLSLTRRRLPVEVFEEVFQFVLKIASEKKLLSGKTVGVDSTTLEADAAMKSIVRRDTGEGWKAYVVRLMREEGVIAPDEKPSDEDVRRFDRKRKDKKVSNEEWVSETDPEAKITKMKDGTTHLAYKAEHVVDLESDLILAAEIRPADHGDPQTLVDSVLKAEENLQAIGCEQSIEEVAADKGYHSVATLEQCQSLGLRTYIPEPKRTKNWTWTDKTPEDQRAVLGNRQRVRRAKGKQLQKRRSEVCERSFAHVCETGGMRRSWLEGLTEVAKRYLLATAAHNLGRVMWKLLGVGKPRRLQGQAAAARAVIAAVLDALCWLLRRQTDRADQRVGSIRPGATVGGLAG